MLRNITFFNRWRDLFFASPHYIRKMRFCTVPGVKFYGIQNSAQISTGCGGLCQYCHAPCFSGYGVQPSASRKRKKLYGDVLPGCKPASLGMPGVRWGRIPPAQVGFRPVYTGLILFWLSEHRLGNTRGKGSCRKPPVWQTGGFLLFCSVLV